MPDKIDELVEAALNHVNPTSSLEDIGKALEIAKTATENAKTNQELRTSVEQLRGEGSRHGHLSWCQSFLYWLFSQQF
jgi:hypothetical protein